MNNTSTITCDNCGREGARIQRSPRCYGKGKGLLIIENVPIISCPHCGESYLQSETMHELERIKLHRKSFAVERPVPVAEYSLAVSEIGNGLSSRN